MWRIIQILLTLSKEQNLVWRGFLSSRRDNSFSLPIQILATLFQDRKCGAELVVEALAALKERQLGDSLALLVEARRRAEKEYQVEYPTMEMK